MQKLPRTKLPPTDQSPLYAKIDETISQVSNTETYSKPFTYSTSSHPQPLVFPILMEPTICLGYLKYPNSLITMLPLLVNASQIAAFYLNPALSWYYWMYSNNNKILSWADFL